MKKHSRIIAAASTILAVLLTVALIYGLKNNATNSDQAIRTRFGCDRITADVRETDVFCNPAFYRNTNITEGEYGQYLDCDERLKSSPPTAEQKQSDPGLSESYETCSDKNKFNAKLVEFRQHLADLKKRSNE